MNNILNTQNKATTYQDKINPMNKVTIAKKGEAAYIPTMDLNDDGKITYEEFKKYCDEKGISEADRQSMFEAMLKTRLIKTADYKEQAQKEEEKEEDSIYSKRGDDKYDEAMDTNHDGTITNDEYMKYCTENGDNFKNKSSNTKSLKLKSAIESYLSNQKQSQTPEIVVETQA